MTQIAGRSSPELDRWENEGGAPSGAEHSDICGLANDAETVLRGIRAVLLQDDRFKMTHKLRDDPNMGPKSLEKLPLSPPVGKSKRANRPAKTSIEYDVAWSQDDARFDVYRNGVLTFSSSHQQRKAIELALTRALRETRSTGQRVIVTSMRNGKRIIEWDGRSSGGALESMAR